MVDTLVLIMWLNFVERSFNTLMQILRVNCSWKLEPGEHPSIEKYIEVFEPNNSVIYGVSHGADQVELNLSVNRILPS